MSATCQHAPPARSRCAHLVIEGGVGDAGSGASGDGGGGDGSHFCVCLSSSRVSWLERCTQQQKSVLDAAVTVEDDRSRESFQRHFWSRICALTARQSEHVEIGTTKSHVTAASRSRQSMWRWSLTQNSTTDSESVLTSTKSGQHEAARHTSFAGTRSDSSRDRTAGSGGHVPRIINPPPASGRQA